MITNYQNPNVAAEICGNHMGSLEIAKQMIKVAAEGGITVAKFQKELIKNS